MGARCPDLPFLPGFTFNPDIGRTKFNRNPQFDFMEGGVPAPVEKVRPNMLGPLSDRYPSIFPRGEVAEIPSWLAFDKQLLSFDAFFKETLQEFKASPLAIRRVKIYFFLEDGTILVREPKQDNSGISQGTFICRQRIRFPPPMDDNFYDIIDFNIGREVEFYGRVFKITDCDKFTRNFLNRCGIAVPDPISTPIDPYMKARESIKDTMRPKKPKIDTDTLGQFLANDGKSLCFFGYWDDRETEYGYLHHLEIHYYLADDTLDIREVMPDHCGEAGFLFIKRMKMPKLFKGLPGVGADSPLTVLNVLGSSLQTSRYVTDPLNCGKEEIEYYKDKDFTIGGVINCYGRKIVLTNCDDYTKEYYRKKYGLDSFTPVEKPKETEAVEFIPLKQRELPPWNGYGSFEDSAQNCRTVDLKPTLKDFKKFLKYDKEGFDSRILRFEARMVSKIPENCTRVFIISYYLADDTISVFELAAKNTGFMKKKFLRRETIKLPGQATFTSKPPEIYKAHHMFVGAHLIINSFHFILINADEYCLRYMEINCHQYPKSNIKLIMDKVREKLRPIYKDFVAENVPNEVPVISYKKLRDKLCHIMGEDFTEHEMITISRAFSANCAKERYKCEDIRAITLTELKRMLWDDLERLGEYFILRDPDRTGKISKQDCYMVLKACRLPVDVQLIEKILEVVKQDENCNIYYHDLLDFLDRTKCPMADVIPINYKYELYWGSDRDPEPGILIDWCAFNKYLDLEDTFKETPGPPTIDTVKQPKE